MTDLMPLMVIAGPTASGKSSLALAVAEVLDGELISADAFAVYRGMDIGTDKPSREARVRCPHHLIDILDLDEPYSAGDFARRAEDLIEEIQARGRLPIVVGGTHFYIKALIEGLCPTPERNDTIRKKLETAWSEDPAGLFERLVKIDPEAAHRIGPGDRQRILRSLEVFESSGRPLSEYWQAQDHRPRYNPLYLAPHREREELYARINMRVDAMFTRGFVAEVQALLVKRIDPKTHALKAIGYRELVEMIQRGGEISKVIETIKRSSRHFAKRQLTWLRRQQGKGLRWVRPLEFGGLEEVVQLWKSHEDSL